MESIAGADYVAYSIRLKRIFVFDHVSGEAYQINFMAPTKIKSLISVEYRSSTLFEFALDITLKID